MYTIEQNKVALSSHDDKRHIVTCDVCKTGSCATCNYETLAHVHYKIKRQRSNDDHDEEQLEAKRLRTVGNTDISN